MASAGAVGTNKFGMDAEFFTRGQVGDADTRGGSMVQKHLEKMQVEKENQALGELSVKLPHFGAAVRVVSLQECSWDVPKAAAMLERFSNDYADELKAIQKKRKRINDLAAEAAEKTAAENAAKASSSDSDQSDSGSSGSSDSDSGRDKKRSRKSSKKKSKKGKDKSRSKGKRSKKEKKEKDRKRQKGDKAEKKASKVTGDAENFGRFGIIKETDSTAKHAEFMAWAVEHKKVNIETLPKNEERELFRDFMEDFNTGTMPHRKYYNLDLYEREKAAKLAKKGIAPKKKSGLDDEREMQRQKAEEAAKEKEARLMAAYQELKYSDKARDMKEQELLRLQMQQAYKTGDKEKAAKILRRLEPEKDK